MVVSSIGDLVDPVEVLADLQVVEDVAGPLADHGLQVHQVGGLTIGLTVLRWASCLGGSMAMNIGSLEVFVGIEGGDRRLGGEDPRGSCPRP